MLLKIIVLLLLGSGLPTSPAFAISAEGGKLTLTSEELNSGTELSGEWAFIPDAFTTESDSHTNKKLIYAPSSWSQTEAGISNEGFGTYFLQVTVPDTSPGSVLALYLPSVASAYRLYIDGELVEQNGSPGTIANQEIPKSYAKVYRFVPSDETFTIALQVSNFSQRKGGMWAPLSLGTDEAISGLRERNMMIDLFIASVLFALGFYLISHYFFRKSFYLPVFLGLFCLLISLRTLLTGELLLIYFFPLLSWELSVKAEYLTFYIGFIMLGFYLYYLFPEETNRGAVMTAVVLTAMFSFTVLFPAEYFTRLLPAFSVLLVSMIVLWVVTVIRAALKRREGSILNLTSVIVLAAAILHDYYFYNRGILLRDWVPVAGAFFLFIQTITVSKKSSYAFAEARELSEEIKQTNQKLERKIAERTRDLVNKNNQLNEIAMSRKSFFSSIAHEIGTPMQSIKGYIQLLQSMSENREQQKYLAVVFEKSEVMNFLIKDLLDLAKMDEGQFELHFDEVDVSYLTEQLVKSVEMDVKNAGRHLLFIPANNCEQTYVKVDIRRMHQVIVNLITNAIRHTKPDDEIRIEASKDEQYFCINVSDNGSGIASDLLPFIFNRFTKEHTRSGSGSGLGLAISHEILKRHNGSINVVSSKGEGSTFTISLPFIDEEDEDGNENLDR